MKIKAKNKPVLITLPPDKLHEFRIKAAKADMTLSQFLTNAGSITQIDQAVQSSPISEPGSQTVTMEEK